MTLATSRPTARRWRAAVTALAMAAAAAAVPMASTTAAVPGQAVLEWNLNAVNALSNLNTATPPGAGQTPPVASEHLAMVQGAVYDALVAIRGGYEPYLGGLPSVSPNASTDAAAATAAHHVLVGLRPTPLPANVIASLNGLYADSLTAIPDGQAKTDGIAIGAAAATAMLNNRDNDGRYGSFRFTAGTFVGEWRPELPSFVSDPFAWVARVRPFTLNSTSQFRTKGPYDVDSPQYAADFNEVKALGAATGSSRTDAQTELARFYFANPLPFMNRALRELAAGHGLTPVEQARAFAMTSMSGADALINCWDDKAHYSFWRPITAIHEAGHDGNPRTTADAAWLPFMPTPPYPDHPSGYNCFSAGTMYAAAAVFGNGNVPFQLTSPVTNTTRSYTRFADVLHDSIDARVYLGFHFRNPDVQGAALGKKVAKWVDKHFFAPTS